MPGFSQAHMNSEKDKVVRPQLMTKQVANEEHRLRQMRQAKSEELGEKQRKEREDKDTEARGSEDKESEEFWDKALSEEQKAKIKRIPQMPTQKEIDEHCATHVPFRDWCEFCVHGKAKDDPHRRAKKPREILIPEVDIDYMWLKGKFPFSQGGEEDTGMPILIVTDRETKFKQSVMVPSKGVDPYAVKTLTEILTRLYGYDKMILGSDQESTIVALKNSVKKEMRGMDIQMKESPVEEHQANSQVESAVRQVQEQVRTMRLAFENRSRLS